VVDDSAHIFVRREDWAGRAWVKMTEDGSDLGSIPIPDGDLEGTPVAAQTYLFGPMHTYPFRTFSCLTRKGDLLVAQNTSYVFHRRQDDGRVVRIERPWEPIPVQRGERRAFQEVEDHLSERTDSDPVKIPRHKPPWWGFWVDQEDRLWVALHGEGFFREESPRDRAARERLGNPPREWWEPLRFDVFEPDGSFLGNLDFPNTQTYLAVARGHHVWVVENGEYDEGYVVRYRIEPEG
jgi:hypothetical protein